MISEKSAVISILFIISPRAAHYRLSKRASPTQKYSFWSKIQIGTLFVTQSATIKTFPAMKSFILLSILVFGIMGATIARPRHNIDNRTVTNLDINRYMGRWYEIARFDHPFERGMERCVADYRLLPDGSVEVLNSGYKEGKHRVSRGKAKTTSLPGELKVTFFIFPAPDKVMELGDNYEWSIVGSSSPNYLWILSRTPTLPDSVQVDLLERCKRRGYDIEELIFVPQE